MVTIEPGIYLPGVGGVRIEDLAVVREDGVELLTSFPKELIEVGGPSRATPAPPMAEVVSTNQFRNGMHIELDGQTWRIVEFQHVKPGKGGAFVRTKLKSLDSRRGRRPDVPRRREVRARPHRDEEHAVPLRLRRRGRLHGRGDLRAALAAARDGRGRRCRSCSRRRRCRCCSSATAPAGIDLPSSVVLEVTETEPGVKGDTVSNVTKPATLETGAVVQVPLFVNVGDKIKVDPREKRYIRAPELRT